MSTAAPANADGASTGDKASVTALQSALTELDRSPGTIAAEVGSRTVTWGDVADAIRALPPSASSVPFKILYEDATLHLAERRALALIGESRGLYKDKIVSRRIREADDLVVADEVLNQSLQKNLDEKELRALYNRSVVGRPGPIEVRSRVIVMDTRQEAETMIARLSLGADFADLARAFSKDPSAQAGGDLGYLRLDMMSPELGAVAFAMSPGQVTPYPVRTGNSYLVVKIEERRAPPTPGFEEARTALSQDMIHLGVPALMASALKSTTVVFYGPGGKPPAKARN